MEEEDGDRQEEEVEVASREASQGECAMWMTMDECEMRSELKPWNVMCETITTVEKCAVRADSVHVRHAIVDVNVVIGVVLLWSACWCTRRSSFTCDAVVRLIHFVPIAIYRSHFSVFGGMVFTPLETLGRVRPRNLEMERVQMMTRCKLTQEK